MKSEEMSPATESRYKVSGNYLGRDAGSWAIDEWLLDAALVAQCVARETANRKNESVKVIRESRLPSGRWGRRQITVHECHQAVSVAQTQANPVAAKAKFRTITGDDWRDVFNHKVNNSVADQIRAKTAALKQAGQKPGMLQ